MTLQVGQKITYRARQDRKVSGYSLELNCDGMTGTVVGLYRTSNTYAEVDLANGFPGVCIERACLEVA